jgi:hypothetical protein
MFAGGSLGRVNHPVEKKVSLIERVVSARKLDRTTTVLGEQFGQMVGPSGFRCDWNALGAHKDSPISNGSSAAERLDAASCAKNASFAGKFLGGLLDLNSFIPGLQGD